MFIVIQRNTNFYSEFYVYIVVWIVCVLEYDEMNCDFVFEVFLYSVFWSGDFG